jgi:Uma2 family endonuclease
MIQAGILADDDPVELLDGWLILRMPKNPPHSLVTTLIRQALERLLLATWHIRAQEPITTDDSEPEPDVTVIRGEPRQYLDHHPGPKDAAIVIEVAHTTVPRDREMKKRLYARAGIPVCWIANLLENRFEVYTDPSGPTEQPDYRHRQDYGPGDDLPVVIDGVEVGRLAVRELLP